MTMLDKILKANEKFVEMYANGDVEHIYHKEVECKFPEQKLVILTCMDTRLINFLEPALGVTRGDVKIIKTAGNTTFHHFDSVVSSLMVAIYELGVEEILLVGHRDCGMEKTSSDSLIKAMKKRGVQEKDIESIEPELMMWADTFLCSRENVVKVADSLRQNPFIPKDVPIHATVIDHLTGKLEILSDGYKLIKK